jgi:glycosyltransferase involved in cell wall biosynthesis
LLKQNNKDFIWLIIDDGSSDNTEELVREWQSRENGFEIEYIKKENGGMHTAHNTAYENIRTELNVCIDSDDCMADNAVEKILSKWKEFGYAKVDRDFKKNNRIKIIKYALMRKIPHSWLVRLGGKRR